MATLKLGSNVASQLDAGASIVAAADTVDTRLIKPRLSAFGGAQRTYKAAHEQVQAAEAHVTAAQMRLGELDVDQDEAVTALAAALIVDGQRRTNPFNVFGVPAPGKLMELAVADEAKAVHQLVAAVQRGKGASKPTLQAAQAAEKAARAVEQALAEIEKLQGSVRAARHRRDAVAQAWATALAALKRGARAAADDGAPTLYATLFDRPRPAKTKSAKPMPAPVPSPAPQPVPNAAA
jgi:hypothetical protein